MTTYNKYGLFLAIFAVILFSCTKEKSELELAAIYTDNMVLQQNKPVVIYGEANAGVNIKAKIGNLEGSAKADDSGKWKINLPELKAGGPYSLNVSSQDTSIVLNNILIGEVWLASGQSNMHLDMSRTLNGVENAKKADNPNIRIMYMQPTFPTGEDGVHTKEELEILNNNRYFNYIGWNKADSTSIKHFSAVAYYFAERLQQTLNVPVGIIHNAVPGSPIESWLSEKLINSDSLIKSYGESRWADTSDIMVSIGKKQVLINNKQTDFKLSASENKHPWMPAYNYVNGIEPIKDFTIAGAIWYQGESNAEHYDIYPRMFGKMVNEWRDDFGNDFPFYYVQLTSRGERPTWPAFRDMQRRMLDSIPNSGMVVITDVGDKDDTHAKNKKPVGERLALLALGDSYGIGENYKSPVFDKMVESDNKITLYFKGTFKKLKTSDGKDVRGFEISYDGEIFKNTKVEIVNNKIEIAKPASVGKIIIRYGWQPYTDANLVSDNSLPVSTFNTGL